MNSFTILKSAHLFSNRNYSFVNFVRETRFQIFLLLLILFCSEAVSQARKPKTYALVMGISKYKDEAITSLNYADKDAQAFVDYCTSPQGLGIAKENTRVLTNESASYWNIIDGLDWLKSVAKKDDQIFIYFAGHGDMESKELKFGYLLAHDSRPMNYLGRSLSLDLLNKTAHTLSIDKKAKVFLITDACHSGKLAGVDFNGSNLVAVDLMRLVSKNEVRITSCSEDELSYEDQAWGNGRGAFSYFLLKGMAGGADGVGGTKDGVINVGEIKAYLGGKVPIEVQNVKQANQNPVIMGSQDFRLNQVKSNTTNENLDIFSANDTLVTNLITSNTSGARSVKNPSVDLAFSNEIIKTVNEKITDKTSDFINLSKENISNINKVLLKSLYQNPNYSKSKLSSPNTNQWIAKALYDKVQNVLDLYLIGDEAELEKRRYYNQVDRPYDQYPYMLDIAMKMLPKDHSLIPSLQMQKEYLIGLSYRLKMPFTKDYMKMVDTSFVYQQKAIALDTNAAYIHNELGILHLYNKNYELAKYHFEKANIIAPMWSLPYSNLANLALTNKDDITAKKYVDLALKKQENFQNPYIIDGSIYMNGNNLLFAEEQFQRAIKINSRHFLPFEKLGELYLKTQDFELANDYYYEAELRKLGLFFLPPYILNSMVASPAIYMSPCFIDSTKVNKRDILANFAVGKYYFDIDSFTIAHRWFEKVISLDVQNPLVYHYIGQTAHYFKSYAKSEFYFQKAIQLHLNDSLFTQHSSYLIGQSKSKNNISCLINTYENAAFKYYLPNIYLARTYEKWGNFSAATEQYNECIKIDEKNNLAYYLLWNLYKSRNEIELAENTIQRFGKIYPEELDHVLADFYSWVLHKYNDDLQKTELYSYKFGLLMHQFMTKSPDKDWGESLEATPDKEDRDYEYTFEDKISFTTHEENDQLKKDVVYESPAYISKPLSTGVIMLKKAVSISLDKNIKADAYAKMGDIYFRAKSLIKALENYEYSLGQKDDDIGIRSWAVYCADELYLFKKAFNHLSILKQMNGLNFEDATLLAKYYMKLGQRDEAVSLSNEIATTHPDLKDQIESDIIITHLRFGEYQKSIELINNYIEKWGETDFTSEYMLARAYAGLNKPDDAMKHLQSADSLGFNLGFVYINDSIFDGFRTSGKAWVDMQKKMEEFITLKMASVKDNSK
jgi:Tfp pilus assembly protein PilF/uncharacterized caspase-like protein